MHGRMPSLCITLGILLIGVVPAWALPRGSAIPWSAAAYDSARRSDVNDIDLSVRNDGMIAFEAAHAKGDLVFPKGSGKVALACGGPWIVARVAGQWRGAFVEYASEFTPGPIVGTDLTDPLNSRYRTYKVRRFTGAPSDTAHVEADLAEPGRDPLLHHSWSEYMVGAAPWGAPVRTYRLPVTTTADPTDSVDVQGPDVPGDFLLWSIYNDADPRRHRLVGGSYASLGVEIAQSVYGVHRDGPLDRATFLRLSIVNRGAYPLDSLAIGSPWTAGKSGG